MFILLGVGYDICIAFFKFHVCGIGLSAIGKVLFDKSYSQSFVYYVNVPFLDNIDSTVTKKSSS